MSDGLDEKRGLCMIGCPCDLLYKLRVGGNIWRLSLKHDIQTWFVNLHELNFIYHRTFMSPKGMSGDL